ncbi:MAG: 16S rRNA (cytidine(1402)-2'-O)-methyltransferase [Chloroflexota bacterium]
MARLIVVPTPIGNLEDITFRAVRVLGEVQAIFAEDTRQTRKLLTRYSLTTPLYSYHQHTKYSRIPAVLEALERGDVALVSSAGTPSISDPGFELVRAALEKGVEIDVLPGASAVVTAVVGAAIPAPGFLFLGFLPRRAAERDTILREHASTRCALVFFEAPHRLTTTLAALDCMLGDRQAVAARELTKLHQQYVRGTVRDLMRHFEEHAPRGEITLVIAGAESADMQGSSDEVRAELLRRREAGQEARTAVSDVASLYHMARNDVYRLWVATVEDRNGFPPDSRSH